VEIKNKEEEKTRMNTETGDKENKGDGVFLLRTSKLGVTIVIQNGWCR
jgi:hypothetical protein